MRASQVIGQRISNILNRETFFASYLNVLPSFPHFLTKMSTKEPCWCKEVDASPHDTEGGFFSRDRAQTPVSNSLSSWPGHLCDENIQGWLMVLNREGKFRRPFTTKPCKKKKRYPAQSRDIILPYTGGPLLPLSPLSKELSRKKFCSKEEEETDDQIR